VNKSILGKHRQSNSAPILTAKHEMEKDTAGCRALNRNYIVGGKD